MTNHRFEGVNSNETFLYRVFVRNHWRVRIIISTDIGHLCVFGYFFKKSTLLWRVDDDDEIQNVSLIFSLSLETSPTRECEATWWLVIAFFGGRGVSFRKYTGNKQDLPSNKTFQNVETQKWNTCDKRTRIQWLDIESCSRAKCVYQSEYSLAM